MSNFIEFENFETGNKVFVNVERILYIAQGESDNSTAIYLVLYTCLLYTSDAADEL